MSEKLIDSGIDQIIFSFDGGTKETYNKMRPEGLKKMNLKMYIIILKIFSN